MKHESKRRMIRTMVPALVFLVVLPPSVFIGIVLVLGHGGYFPYVSAWLDRIAFAVLALGIPFLAAMASYRLVARRDKADAGGGFNGAESGAEDED